MRDRLHNHVAKVETLLDIEPAVISLFREIRETEKQTRIGYVAGIITSDGPEYIERNAMILSQHCDQISLHNDFPIFAAPHIFSDDIYTRFTILRMPKEEQLAFFIPFWRNILSSGYVTDIFMTPRWQESFGAKDEHETATKIGLTIHYTN